MKAIAVRQRVDRASQRVSSLTAAGPFAVALSMWRRQSAENLGLIAAGIAFYGLLSLFPGITAAVALAGVFIDPDILVENSVEIANMLPDAAEQIVVGQLNAVLNSNSSALSFAAAFSLAVVTYSSSRMVSNFIAGLNVIYRVEETRNFFIVKALTVVLTLVLIVGLIFAVIAVAALPVVANIVGDLGWIDDLVLLSRWPILFLMGAAGIALLYRFGPNRKLASRRWLTPGALTACSLWVIGSYGFSTYVSSFGSYNETFGALGGVIVLLTWLWLSAFIVLLGALLDAEIAAARPSPEAVAIPFEPEEADAAEPGVAGT